MPYTPAQNRLFRAAAHDPEISKSAGLPTGLKPWAEDVPVPVEPQSMFAAFDPLRRIIANILAGTAAVVPTTGLASYLINNKDEGYQ